MGMLVRGNSKLGKDIWTFSIPAIETCPGASSLCKKICYAARYEKRWPSVHKKYEENLEKFNSKDMIREILDKKCKVVRVHVAGDFYSSGYIEQWLQVVDSLPHVVFYAYTRSWANTVAREPRTLGLLRLLAARDNVTLILSLDKSMVTTIPANVKETWRWATIGDVPMTGNKKVITCPEQTGKAESCSKCKLCFSPKLKDRTDIVIKFLEH